MINDIQVVTIGNAFELVYRQLEDYMNLSELAKVDECHFGQKAGLWSTRHGEPDIAVCTSAPSDKVLDATYEGRARPTFIAPGRVSSSICRDLLTDSSARGALLSSLDINQKVYLAPYVHTSNVEELADFLLYKGYSLIDYQRQARLVRLLWNKVDAERLVFQPVDLLRKHRPKSIVADSANQLFDGIAWFARRGAAKVVVKSAAAVGGAGVFFVDTRSARKGASAEDFLIRIGQNEADRSAPFLIEERVHSDASPTVDIEVTQSGSVEIVGIALQRLFDDRYYTGFYSSPELEERWWFKSVETLAKVVGYKLHDLGYVGPVNVDFVVSFAEHRITLVEVNPRRSALIDGFSLRKARYDSLRHTSVSVADYVNISGRFVALEDAFAGLVHDPKRSAIVLPVADGGFCSRFRWAGVVAFGVGLVDSEDVLEQAVLELQDPERDEIGCAERNLRSYGRISEKVA